MQFPIRSIYLFEHVVSQPLLALRILPPHIYNQRKSDNDDSSQAADVDRVADCISVNVLVKAVMEER
jgi:hypothetical protein